MHSLQSISLYCLFKDKVEDSLFVMLKNFNCAFYVQSVSLFYLFKDKVKDSLFVNSLFVTVWICFNKV